MKKVLTLRHRKKIPKLISNNPTIESSIWSSSAGSSPPWIELPFDVMGNILLRLGPEEIMKSAQFVCATWWRVCKDPSLWRVIYMIGDPADEKDREISRFLKRRDRRRNSGDKDNDVAKISATNMCCRAVDRSQGGLINLSIGYFCTENLLRYVSDRSSPRLKRLTIAAVISGKCLSAAIKKFGGELEEVRLFYTRSITAEDIETIGTCCPMLNTFAFNNSAHRFRGVLRDDGPPLAIAKNMPNLRHLELYLNAFTEKGLQAILDGCPCLESLDLRRTHIRGLEDEDLRKRCSWIEEVRLPSESTWRDDYESESEDEEYDRQKGDRYRGVHMGGLYGKGKMNLRTGTLVFE